MFRSKRADRLKILAWDGSGLVLFWKRLEHGAPRTRRPSEISWLFANSAEVVRCPGPTGPPETAHLRLGGHFGGLSLATKSRFPETETAEGRDSVRMRRLL